MSIRLWAGVWSQRLTPAEKLVLLYYADCANKEGRAWPGPRTIMRNCGISRSTMMRARNTLQRAGYLEKIHGEEIGGKPIFLVFSRTRAERHSNVVQIDGQRGRADAASSGKNDAGGLAPDARQ